MTTSTEIQEIVIITGASSGSVRPPRSNWRDGGSMSLRASGAIRTPTQSGGRASSRSSSTSPTRTTSAR